MDKKKKECKRLKEERENHFSVLRNICYLSFGINITYIFQQLKNNKALFPLKALWTLYYLSFEEQKY